MVINLSPTRIDDALKCKLGGMSVAELAERISGRSEPTDDMRLGTVCHQIAERGMTFDPGPAQIDGFTLSAELVEYLRALPSTFGGKPVAEEWCRAELSDGIVKVIVRGRIDLLTPDRVVDYKFGRGKMWHGHERRWRESAAWKAYSLACGGKRCVYHYTQIVADKARLGLLTVGEVKTVEFEPTDYTAADLFIAAVDADAFMRQAIPAEYEAYRHRVEHKA